MQSYKQRKSGHVYILRCADGSYYTGSTSNLEGRLSLHNAGRIGGYTQTRRPVRLVYSQWFAEIADAVSAERRIKGWTRRKKEALIAGDYELLVLLSKSRSRRAGRE
ncbi:MAG: GIY-YIG nuclease family protein [candidate division Zixibacteria bacterium]|nr:GIY-YIG nuclease family protein [candidate division Zixibacteria bacterium]